MNPIGPGVRLSGTSDEFAKVTDSKAGVAEVAPGGGGRDGARLVLLTIEAFTGSDDHPVDMPPLVMFAKDARTFGAALIACAALAEPPEGITVLRNG